MTRRDAITRDLFAVPRAAAAVPASMDYRAQVSHLVSAMLADAHAAGLDRYEVASRASRLAGRDVSKAMRVRSLHPGVELSQVQENTGFEVLCEGVPAVTQMPSTEELSVLRQKVDRTGVLRPSQR